MIQFEHVSKRYEGGQDALRDVSFTLESGEMAYVTGHSGAGKSTLLKLIMLMEKPTGGRIQVGNRQLTQLARQDIPLLRRSIGVVFQNHQLLYDRTVFDNVMLPLQICGYSPEYAARRVRAALSKVGLLNQEKMKPLALSSGEQQRVGIARAIVHKPKVLLADEPTGNLDPLLSAEIMALFQQFNRVGTTVLVASHDLSLLRQMPHRTLTLRQGRLVGDG